ncbi:MAG: hypothetical protein H6975_04660 [Gammaproteobacteria bacterium]|nr:hypothetical protein [Gammaproteobacteria bacterium]
MGIALLIIGSIGLLISAFKTSIVWGVGCLLFTPVSFLYVIFHWSDAKNPFLLQLVGIAAVLLGAYGSETLV